MDTRERLDLLRPLISFRTNDFIFIQILQRRKDNPELELGVKRIKSYSFYSWKELEKQFDRIVELCDLNNARAYIRLNKQNSVDVSLRCIEEISKNLRNGNPDNNRNVWDSISGQGGSKDWWVLDLDTEHLESSNTIKEELKIHFKIREEKILGETIDKMNKLIGESKIGLFGKMEPITVTGNYGNMFPLIENPTKSGIHLIVKPFDTRILDKYNKELSAKQLPTIQIQKDANTILYIGTSKTETTYE